MKNTTRRGFTLIELLIVIAIIGILAAIVLASLGTARSKANDAKSQDQLSNMREAAEIYNNTNNNYGSDSAVGDNVCSVTSGDTSGLYGLEQASNYPGGVAPTCTTNAGVSSPATAWSAYVPLTNGSFYCVDSTGASKPEPIGWTPVTGGNPCT